MVPWHARERERADARRRRVASANRAAIALSVLVASAGVVGCLDPSDRRPGLALSGEVAAVPDDWSFTDGYREIAIEVGTPYWLPHSVTIWCSSVAGDLYVGARNPDEKHWPGWADRDPDVRLKVGERVYEVRLEPLDDTARIARVTEAMREKYDLPETPAGEGPPIRFWQVVARNDGSGAS